MCFSRAILQATSTQAYRGTSGSGKGGKKKENEKEKDKVFVGEVSLRFRCSMAAAERKDPITVQVSVSELLKYMTVYIYHFLQCFCFMYLLGGTVARSQTV